MNIVWKMYAGKNDDGSFSHVYYHSIPVSMCGVSEDKIVKVEVRLDDSGRYWGWLNNKELSMIWPSKMCLGMCFPYGMQVEINKGNGAPVQLNIKETP